MSQTFNSWSVVNLVFNHLAEKGLHPELGGADPEAPAAELLRALGVEPGRDDEGPAAPAVQQELADIRAAFFGES